MASEDFNEFIDGVADGLKRAVTPFGSLFNPQSAQRDKQRISELEARVKRQDRLLDSQIDTINDNAAKLREVISERDALRSQIDSLTGHTSVGLDKPEG